MACLNSEVLFESVSATVADVANFKFSTFDGSVTTKPISSLSINSAPECTSEAPLLAELTLPNPLAGSVPEAPNLDDVTVPADPTVELPEVPTLLSLDIPDEPVLSFPEFQAVFREAPIPPNGDFIWSDKAYSSALLSNLALKQSKFILGLSTAIPDNVEALISEKFKDSKFSTDHDTIANTFDTYGSRGFSGSTGPQLRKIFNDFDTDLEEVSEKSRDLMLEQIRLEQQNMIFGMVTGIRQQVQVYDDHNRMQQRILDAATIAVDSKIALFNAQLGLARVDVQVFAALVDIFKEKLKAQLARLDVFRAQLEARRLLADLDVAAVNLYVAQLEGVKSKVEIFKSTVDAARAKLSVDVNNVDIFKAKVEGVRAELQGKKSEVDGFVEKIRAETLKFDIFAAKADAHKTKAEIFKTMVDGQVAAQLAQFNANQRAPAEVFKQQNRSVKAQADAERIRAESMAALQRQLAKLFRAETSSEVKIASSQIDSEGALLKSQAANDRVEFANDDADDRREVASEALSAAKDRAALQSKAMQEAATISVETFNTSITNSNSTSVSQSTSVSETEAKNCTDIKSAAESSTFNFMNVIEMEGIGIDLSGRGPGLGRCR